MGSTESEGEWHAAVREAALKPYVGMPIQAQPGLWGQLSAPLPPTDVETGPLLTRS